MRRLTSLAQHSTSNFHNAFHSDGTATPFAVPNGIGNGAMSHLVTPGAEPGTAAP
jgi:hypothetical protein